jgi:hypothetical protein
MPLTVAERQRSFRQRQIDRIAELEAESAGLRSLVDELQARAESAEAEAERLAGMACKHPAAAVDGGRCMACGADVW